jgi:hypothetical protein
MLVVSGSRTKSALGHLETRATVDALLVSQLAEFPCSDARTRYHQHEAGGSLRRLKAELQTIARQANTPGIDWGANSTSALLNSHSHLQERTSWIVAAG